MQINFVSRLKSDFFRKSKISQYKSLLEYALRKEYVFLTLIDYFNLLNAGNLPKKFVVIRHDIDNHV